MATLTSSTAQTAPSPARPFFVPPRLTDSRLHVAAVVMTLHVLGQTAFGFRVTIPQIMAAIGSCWLLEAAISVVTRRQLIWPASAMLTGSGVALILRDAGTASGDHWGTQRWWLFAGVALASLATKYVLRWRGQPVFNPSNVGLVVAFLVLGSERIEPLDLWWGPFSVWMLVAYWLIVAGGLLVADRLQLLEMVVTFWILFAVALGVLAAPGHCITTPWSFQPVCDQRFWWITVTSPELLVFQFFMLTDPRTIPGGREARRWFAAGVALLAVVLIAGRSTEFGTKVGLLGALVVMCGARVIVDVLAERAHRVRLPRFTVATALPPTLAALFLAVMLGAPVRVGSAQVDSTAPHPATFVPVVDADRIPPITIDPGAAGVVSALAGDEPSTVAGEMVRSLDVEALAAERNDPDLLASADHGVWLARQTARMSRGDGIWLGDHRFDSMELTSAPAPGQGGLRPAIRARGTARIVVGRGRGDVVEVDSMFVLRRGDDGRWMIVDVSPSGG